MARPGYKATAVDQSGDVLGAILVTVRKQSDNSLADLYTAASGGSTLANPFNAEANGDFEFYADSDDYLVFLGAGASPQSFPLPLADTYADSDAVINGVTVGAGTGTEEIAISKGALRWIVGPGDPEGTVVADVGSMFLRTDGGAGTTLYIKETGAGNTGWDQVLSLAASDARYAQPGDIITDHGALTGLSDDDHPQYHNDARGDARYLRTDTGGTVNGDVTLEGGGLQTNTTDSGDTLANNYTADDTVGGRVVGGKKRVATAPLTGDRIAEFMSRSIDPNTGDSIRTRELLQSEATENHDHAASDLGQKGSLHHVPVGASATKKSVEWNEDGVIAGVDVNGGDYQHILNAPTGWGADTAGSDTANDAVFATMETQLQDREVDLEGKTWPVTHVPNLNARNGYWLVTNFSQSMDVRLAARDTREMTILGIEGGKTTVAWAQDVYAAYNGVMIGGYMPADGHTPGSQDWTVFRITEHGRNIADFEPRQNFGNTNENEVFGATVVPPSTSGGAYDGAFHYAISNRSNGLLTFHYRALAEYEQDNTGGGLDQGQGNWSESSIDGVTFGSALRGAVNSAYSVSTSGTPTVVHGLNLYGGSDGAAGNVLFGFHGLSGFSRPCIGYIDGTPKDGAGSINFVGNVANLSVGVEPTVCWYKNGGSSRLCGFVRSQGSSYPIRFWSTQGPGLTQAAVEGAATQDCPGGNDFGTYSPIPCRMRPRRKGSVSGWIATWETIDGDTDDELHFTFTDTRTRDGGPGVVWLYHGKVTRGSGHFDTMWDRAEITALYPLYFSNSNSTDTSNQVGVSSMAWIDSNTLVIGASTMRPAISGDEDEAMLLNFVLKFDDDYADTSERRQWDDGTQVPMDVFRAPEFVDYRGERMALGERVIKVISADAISYTGQGNIVVAPQSGSADDLDTILNGRDGDIVTLRSNSSSNTITIVNGTGNFALDTSLGNFVLDNARDRITLIYDSGSNEWAELSRSNNGT